MKLSGTPALGFGTAFFIGGKEGKLALTAAHCVCKTESDILDDERNNKTALVFNFTMKNKHEVESTFSKSEVYKFKVISHQYIKTKTQ